MKDKLNNLLVDITTFIRKRIYILAPLITLIILLIDFIFFKRFIVTIDNDLNNNIANISGVLFGFLLTAYGIFLSLPDNNFIRYLKLSKHFEIVLKTLLYGICFFVLSMLLGIFKVLGEIMLIVFLCGISEVVISIYYFYKITNLSSKSN